MIFSVYIYFSVYINMWRLVKLRSQLFFFIYIFYMFKKWAKIMMVIPIAIIKLSYITSAMLILESWL